MDAQSNTRKKHTISLKKVVKIAISILIAIIFVIAWYMLVTSGREEIDGEATGYLQCVYIDEGKDTAIFVAVVNASEEIEVVRINWNATIYLMNYSVRPAIWVDLNSTNSSIEWIDINDDGMLFTGDIIILHRAKQWSGWWLVVPIGAHSSKPGMCISGPLWGKIP